MKYLLTRTDVFRCDTEQEAEQFLTQLKNSGEYDVNSSTITKRELKQKGEVVDEWVRLTVKKIYNSEKEPEIPFKEEREDSNIVQI